MPQVQLIFYLILSFSFLFVEILIQKVHMIEVYFKKMIEEKRRIFFVSQSFECILKVLFMINLIITSKLFLFKPFYKGQVKESQYKKAPFMICSVQNVQFMDKFLQMSPQSLKQMLKQQDQKYILRKKQQIIRNMPDILKPNQDGKSQTQNFIKTFYGSSLSKKGGESKGQSANFPSKFQSKTRNHFLQQKIKQQEKNLFQSSSKKTLIKVSDTPFTFQSGINGQFSEWKGEKLPLLKNQEDLFQPIQATPVKEQMNIQKKIQTMQREFTFENEKELSFKKYQQKDLKQNQQKQADNMQAFTQQLKVIQNQRISQVQNPFVPPFNQPKNSPFISNKTNFLDPHTNKKSKMGNYLSPQIYSMNMLQFAHNRKIQNTFDDRYSYPNVVMGGSGTGWMKTAQEMRQNPFKKTFVPGSKEFNNSNQSNYESNYMNTVKIEADNKFRGNVEDVLKYTLGDRRFTATVPDRTNQIKNTTYSQVNNYQNLKKQVPQNRKKVLQNPFLRRPASTYKY